MDVMPEVLWCLLTSDVLVQMHLAPVCILFMLIVVLCAGDLFTSAETLGFFFPLSEQSVQRIQLCVLGRIFCVIGGFVGFNGELVEWGWGEKRKQECFSALAATGEAALLILWLIMISGDPLISL